MVLNRRNAHLEIPKGGEEPIDAIKKHFGEFCRQHPHIEMEIMARYIEQTPCDIITIQDGEIEEG